MAARRTDDDGAVPARPGRAPDAPARPDHRLTGPELAERHQGFDQPESAAETAWSRRNAAERPGRRSGAGDGAARSNGDQRIDVSGPVLGRVAALLLTLLVLAKAYGAARFSLTTGTALVTAAPVSVLVGTLASYLYAFMAFLTAVSLWIFIKGLHRKSELRPWCPLTFAVTLFAGLLTPIPYLIWALIFSGVALVLSCIFRARRAESFFRRRTPSGIPPSQTRIAVSVAILVAVGFIFATIQRPWLSAEVVTLSKPITVNRQTHKQSMKPVAFVISQENGWVTMLIEEDRYLAFVPARDILTRKICHLNGQLGDGQPLYYWILNRPYQSPNLSCPG